MKRSVDTSPSRYLLSATAQEGRGRFCPTAVERGFVAGPGEVAEELLTLRSALTVTVYRGHLVMRALDQLQSWA